MEITIKGGTNGKNYEATGIFIDIVREPQQSGHEKQHKDKGRRGAESVFDGAKGKTTRIKKL